MIARRRIVIALGAGALAPFASLAPLAGFAQQPPRKIARIGFLSPLSAATATHNFDALRQGLRDLGWVEGRNIAIEIRYGQGNLSLLPALAGELLGLNVDVIVTGSTPGALAVKNATRTVPIVMVTTGDPVAAGIVASLARPGGNVTGMTALGRELGGKRLALLKEAFPRITRVAVITNPLDPEHAPVVKELETAARSLGVQLQLLEVRAPGEFEHAFAAIARERAGAVMALTNAVNNTHRARIIELVAKSRLPAMYGFLDDADAGGLMFYGASLAGMYGRAATHVDKILKGAKPADLPVEQPTVFDLVINMKTAKALGIKFPQSILVQATKVIE